MLMLILSKTMHFHSFFLISFFSVFLTISTYWMNSVICIKITQFAHNLQLLNLDAAGGFNFPASHPSLSNPSRSTTIDYCLCTNRVVQCVTYATMAPYDLGSLGDHRGILIDINIAMLWNNGGVRFTRQN